MDKLKRETLADYAVKAELYVVSLTFSLLALSVQFPIKVVDPLTALLQAAGWILLTIAGVAGLKSLRNVSEEYSLEVVRDFYESRSGKVAKNGRLLEKTLAEMIKKDLAKIKGQADWIFPVQGWCLFAGLSSLVLARIAALRELWQWVASIINRLIIALT